MINKKKIIPPEVVQSRIICVFNSLNLSNLQQKCDEILSIASDDYWPWIAQYLVTRYVSTDMHSHIIYSDFLDCLEKSELNEIVIRETFDIIKILLKNDDEIVSFSDRSVLKNLGHWLGMLTLKKNKPILQIDFDLKALLIDAYNKGQQALLHVVPFIAKVLESCAHSRVFHPPNPWTMAIMNVLAKLYQEPNLILNLKFEIEVLYKNLNIDEDKLKPVDLKNFKLPLPNVENEPEISNNQQQAVQNPIEGIEKFEKTNLQPIQPASTALHLFTDFPLLKFTDSNFVLAGFDDITQHIIINDRLPFFETHPDLKQLVRPAIEKTIQEWFYPIVDKSIKIALAASEEITFKDFALDPDGNRMRIAAKRMTHSLIAGLVLISCTSELSTSMADNLKKTFLEAMTESDQQQKDLATDTVDLIVVSNTKVACTFIQKTAIEQALLEIDKKVMDEIEFRKITYNDGRRYFDPVIKYQAERIPERLRLTIGTVNPRKMVVYREFEKLLWNFLPSNQVITVQVKQIQLPLIQKQACDFDNSPNLMQKTETLLRQWISMYENSNQPYKTKKSFDVFIHQMNVHGIFKTNDSLIKFFKLISRMCVDNCYFILTDPTIATTFTRSRCFLGLDAFAHLAALFVKYANSGTNIDAKINIFNKILGTIVDALFEDHEKKSIIFQQLPYYRIFLKLLDTLCVPETIPETITCEILEAFCNIFHILRPSEVPKFCYAWMDIISYNAFVTRILSITHQQEYHEMYAELLIDLFKYFTLYFQNFTGDYPVTHLYTETQRILLMLSDDYPEILSDHYYRFCDIIPLNCITIKNIILSALPKPKIEPDPSSTDVEPDMLPEIARALSVIHPISFQDKLDSYLNTKTPVTFLTDLRNYLQISQENGVNYNIQLINALVLYLGTQAVSFICNKGGTINIELVAHSTHINIFYSLITNLDAKGRYLFLNAIVNQLRYSNNYTHFFSYALLYLFTKVTNEHILEQITKVLVERLIVDKPHPWGLVVTFVELVKNPTYKLLSYKFAHCNSDIRRMLEFAHTLSTALNQLEIGENPNGINE